MNWFPLCNYTHYSLLKGFSKPKELAKKCAKNSYKACGIADYKSISGAVSFYKECINHDIKPILGCSFDNFSLFAKNKDGWFDLIKLVSSLDKDNNINTKVLLSICTKGNLISIAKNEVDSPITGQDFYVKSSAFMDIYYANREDAPLHNILLCSSMKTTLPKIKSLLRSEEAVENKTFFESTDYFLRGKNDASEILINDKDAIDSFEEIYNKCETYNILSKPILPNFPTPQGESEEDYLKELCRHGWSDLLIKTGKVKEEQDKEIYLDRFTKEFDVIKSANLFGYFLIVQDIISHVNEMGWLSGPGRGSAAGCLISYLVGITQIDPIEFDLLFERFYNSGRNTKNNISLPDIDMDVPGHKRDEIIGYLKEKYVQENVSQMLTFGRLQGRSALKEVLRINAACGFSEMNEITKTLPNEADISDQLQEMDEEDRSIIRWTLENNPDDLREYCFINDNGELDGDYAQWFEQAIRIEGTFKTQGKHAAGVVISADELNKVCPMVNPKRGEGKIAGLEMADLEALGHVKFDVLGINLLDKLMMVEKLTQK